MLTPSFVRSMDRPIATCDVTNTDELAQQIQSGGLQQFTGRLDLSIKDTKSQNWSLYFCQGGLIGGASEMHPMRRWRRQLAHHCPQLDIEIVDRGSDGLPCWDYNSLATLVRQGTVLPGQMAALIEGNITEILFDIHQRWERVRYRSDLQLTYRQLPEHVIHSSIAVIRTDQVWQQALQAWKTWQKAGLVDCSPNLAPAIWTPEKLRQRTSPAAYNNLTTRIDGNQTLRDLAVKLKQNLLPLTQSLMPYISEGLITLIEVGDYSCSLTPDTTSSFQPSFNVTPVNPVLPQPQSNNPLVACIDDSQMDGLIMSQILNKAGYRCITIQDPVKALPILLENKPELIFLDLVMPVANGYEICAQLRRVSVFKNTPVIILTSSDGIVDRVRSKMVGSSGFLAKPINPEKVLTVLQKYLPTPTPASSERLSTMPTEVSDPSELKQNGSNFSPLQKADIEGEFLGRLN
ncbi:MAG: response regulator [Coleofasciculus sp. S288]|nr:response regulator [Coleofasciculus sp. S288]